MPNDQKDGLQYIELPFVDLQISIHLIQSTSHTLHEPFYLRYNQDFFVNTMDSLSDEFSMPLVLLVCDNNV